MEEMPQMKTPACVDFRPSQVEENKIGVWVKSLIKEGAQFGPYGGEKKKITDHCDPYYSWEIRGPKGRRLFCIDAANPKKSNWMRYIKCARYHEEQNMIALQQQKQIYYKTIKDVTPDEELLCWFNIRTESKYDVMESSENEIQQESESTETVKAEKASKKTDDTTTKTSKKSEKQRNRSSSPGKRSKQGKDGKLGTSKQSTAPSSKKKSRNAEGDSKSKSADSDADREMATSGKKKKKAETVSGNVSKDQTLDEKEVVTETVSEAEEELDDNEELPVLDKTPEDDQDETVGDDDVTEEGENTREEAMPILEKMSPDSDGDETLKKVASDGSKKIAEADSTTMEIDGKFSGAKASRTSDGKHDVKEDGGGDDDDDDNDDDGDDDDAGDDEEVGQPKKEDKLDSKSADSTFEEKSSKRANEKDTHGEQAVEMKPHKPVYLKPRLDGNGKPIIYTDVKQFKYDITDKDIVRGKRRKPMYKCMLCSCMVEHPHSLRRHYFKHHVEGKYKNLMPPARPVKIIHKREKIRTRAASCEDKKSPSEDSLSVESKSLDGAVQDELAEVQKVDIDVPSKEAENEMEPQDEYKQNDDEEDEMDDYGSDNELVIDEDKLKEEPSDANAKPAFPCKFCGKVLKSPKRLTNHMLTHPKQGIMECPKCNRKFLCKQGLERHLLTHTGEKPHRCKYCAKGFSTTTNVRRHERLHARDKKHPCHQCPISFIQASDLQKHLQSEHGEIEDSVSYATDEVPSLDTEEEVEEKKTEGTPKKKVKLEEDSSGQTEQEADLHSCVWCGKKFNNPTSLKRHASHAHKDVYSKPSKKKFKYEAPVNIDDEEEPDGYVEMAGLSDSISENLSKYLDGKIQTSQDDEGPWGEEYVSDQSVGSETPDSMPATENTMKPMTETYFKSSSLPAGNFSKTSYQGRKVVPMKTTTSSSTSSSSDAGQSILGSVLTESTKSRFMPAIKQHVEKLVKGGSSKTKAVRRIAPKIKPGQGRKISTGSASRRSSDSSSVKSEDYMSDIIQPPSPYTRPPYQGSSGPKDCGIFTKPVEAHSGRKGQASSVKSPSKSVTPRSPTWSSKQGSANLPSSNKATHPSSRPSARSPRGPFFKPRDTVATATGASLLKASLAGAGPQPIRMVIPKQNPTQGKVLHSPPAITQTLKYKSGLHSPPGIASKTTTAQTPKAMSSSSQKSPVYGSKPGSIGSPTSKTTAIPTSPLFSASHPLKRQASYSESSDVLDLSIKRPRSEESSSDTESKFKPSVKQTESVCTDSDMPLDLSCPATSKTKTKSERRSIFSKGNMRSSTVTKPGLSSQVTTLYAKSEGLLARAGMAITNQSWNDQSGNPGNQAHDLSERSRRELPLVSPTEESALSEEEIADLLSANNDRSFTCNVCKSPFSSMKDLHQHVTVHASEWKFKCEFCIQLFKDANVLVQHRLKKHRVGKTYACSACQREFSYLSNLEKHQVDLHPNIRCTYAELGPGILRRQNFTDPAKSVLPNENSPGVSEQNRISQLIEQAKKYTGCTPSPRKLDGTNGSPRKPVNPQRHHPFLGLRPGVDLLGTATVESAQEYVNSLPANQCTKCLKYFDDVTAFHKHIFICAVRLPGKRGKRGARKGRPPKNSYPDVGDPRKYKVGFGFSKKLKQKAMKQTNVIGKGFRARPGQKIYNPLNHTRRREKADLLDTFKCQACQREFSNITNLERHMKVCPNRDKLRKETLQKTLEKIGEGYDEQSKQLLQQHRCPHCTRQFTYLQSLKKHAEICNLRRDADGHRLTKKMQSGGKKDGGGKRGMRKKRVKHGGRKKRQRDETITAEQLMMMEILGDRPLKRKYKRRKVVETTKVVPLPQVPAAGNPVSKASTSASATNLSLNPQLTKPAGDVTKVEKLEDATKVHFVNMAATQSILEKRLREDREEMGSDTKGGQNKTGNSNVATDMQITADVLKVPDVGKDGHETDSDNDTSSIDSDELPLSKLKKSMNKKEQKESESPVKTDQPVACVEQLTQKTAEKELELFETGSTSSDVKEDLKQSEECDERDNTQMKVDECPADAESVDINEKEVD